MIVKHPPGRGVENGSAMGHYTLAFSLVSKRETHQSDICAIYVITDTVLLYFSDYFEHLLSNIFSKMRPR